MFVRKQRVRGDKQDMRKNGNDRKGDRYVTSSET